MAERRMFAKSVVLSDVFLDMPLSARCLYFTLGMLADDDGFVGNPKSIMRQCGASQDDMAILLQKRYVLGFESGVIVIKHWRMNNYLQNDRHKSTTYLEELSTLEIDNKGAYTEKKGMYTECIHNVYTGKDSIDKDSIDKSISNDILRPTSEVERVVSEWNNLPKPIKKVKGLKVGTLRYKMLTTRIKEYGIDDVLTAVRMVGESDFLRRGSDKGWIIDFEWFVKPNNFPKILEGKYANNGTPAQNYRTIPKENWDSYMWNNAIKDGYATNEEYREWRTKNVTV